MTRVDVQKFLNRFSNKELKQAKSPRRLGFIDPDYTSGLPSIIWDGQSTPTTKKYPHLASYTPVAGDRVLVLYGVIQGKIVRE